MCCMMELDRLQELPGRADEPHPDLSESVPLVCGGETSSVLSDNIMEHHDVTLENHSAVYTSNV